MKQQKSIVDDVDVVTIVDYRDMQRFPNAKGYSRVPLKLIRLTEATLESLNSAIIQADDLGAPGQVRRDIKDNALQGLEQVIADNVYDYTLGTPFIAIYYADGRTVLHQGAHRVMALIDQSKLGELALLLDGAPPSVVDFIDTNIKPRSSNDVARSHDPEITSRASGIVSYAAGFAHKTGRRREITAYERNKLLSDSALLEDIDTVTKASDQRANGVSTRGVPLSPLLSLGLLAKRDSAQKYAKALDFITIVRTGAAAKTGCPAALARDRFVKRRDNNVKTDREHNQRLLTVTFDAFMRGDKLDAATFTDPTRGSPLLSLDVGWIASRVTHV